MQMIQIVSQYRAYTKLDNYDRTTFLRKVEEGDKVIPVAYYKKWALCQPSIDELGAWFMGVRGYSPVRMVSALDLMERYGWLCPCVHGIKHYTFWDRWILDNFRLSQFDASEDFKAGKPSELPDRKYY